MDGASLAKLVEHLQMQRDALQLKLNDLGFKDTSEDDALQEAMIAKFHKRSRERRASANTKWENDFVTRMKSLLRAHVWYSYLGEREREREI